MFSLHNTARARPGQARLGQRTGREREERRGEAWTVVRSDRNCTEQSSARLAPALQSVGAGTGEQI